MDKFIRTVSKKSGRPSNHFSMKRATLQKRRPLATEIVCRGRK